jgi:hypothetical protein
MMRVGVGLEQHLERDEVLGVLQHPLTRGVPLQVLQGATVRLERGAVVGVEQPVAVRRDLVVRE